MGCGKHDDEKGVVEQNITQVDGKVDYGSSF